MRDPHVRFCESWGRATATGYSTGRVSPQIAALKSTKSPHSFVDSKGCSHEEELVALQLSCCLDSQFKVQVVEDAHTERGQREHVKRRSWASRLEAYSEQRR
jgi:hypothetical protein